MILTVDTETTGLDFDSGARPFLVTTCTEDGKLRTWEWPVNPITRAVDVPRKDRSEIGKYLFGHELIFHHAQFDMRGLAFIGLPLTIRSSGFHVPSRPGLSLRTVVDCVHDTMFMSHLVDSRGVYSRMQGDKVVSTHALKDLCLVRLGVSVADEETLRKATIRARLVAKQRGWTLGKDKRGAAATDSDYWMVKAIDRRSQLCRTYAEIDVRERTMGLFLLCREMLQEDGLWEMYLREIDTIPLVYMVEDTGIYCAKNRLKSQIDFHEQQAAVKVKQLHKIAKDDTINLESPAQLSKLLYDKWKLETPIRTAKTDQPSTNAEALTGIRDYLDYHPSPENHSARQFLNTLIGHEERDDEDHVIAKHPGLRVHEKCGDYLRMYERELDETSRFCPSIFPCGTGTTRWATEGSQNIGKKVYEGVRSLRYPFGPKPGSIWAAIDYSQLELRVFAGLSQDPELLALFDAGHDFHMVVACAIFNLPPEKITVEQRRIAKNTNFAIIYGGSPWKVDATAGVKGAYDRFSKQFPNARTFMDETIAGVRECGYVLTVDGYPLWTPPAEPFKGLDYRIQGTAGRIVKLAMRWLCEGRERPSIHDADNDHYFRKESPLVNWRDTALVLQIHDELIFEIDMSHRTRSQAVSLIRRIMRTMEEAGESMGLTTPVECDIHTENWEDSLTIREYLKGVVA